MRAYRWVIALALFCFSLATVGQSAYGCDKTKNESGGKSMPVCGRGGFKRSSDQDVSGKGHHGRHGHHGWSNWRSEDASSETDQGSQGSAADKQAAIDAVKEAYATQKADFQKQLSDEKTQLTEDLQASTQGFVDNVISLAKEGKFTEIMGAVEDFLAERDTIRADSKAKTDGIQGQIDGLDEQEAQAIKAIQEQFKGKSKCKHGKPGDQDGAGDADGTDNGSDTTPDSYDYGDLASSTLTTKAWDALNDNDLDAVKAYTAKTIELYQETALEQQASLSGFAPEEEEDQYWALNDVATSYYILAQAQAKAGDTDEAKKNYQYILDNLKYAQCWDTQGWYWKVAEAAQEALDELD